MSNDLFKDEFDDIRTAAGGSDPRPNPISAGLASSRPRLTDAPSSGLLSTEKPPLLFTARSSHAVAGRRAPRETLSSESPYFLPTSYGLNDHNSQVSALAEAAVFPKVTGLPELSSGAELVIATEPTPEDFIGLGKKHVSEMGYRDLPHWMNLSDANRTANRTVAVAHVEVDPGEVQRAAECERQRMEIRSLQTSLDSINAKLKEIDENLDTKQAKLEAELVELCTTQITKSMELEHQEQLFNAACEVQQQATLCRIDAMRTKYAEELASFIRKTHDLESARYKSQVQNLQESLAKVVRSVRDLHQARSLLIHAEPYTTKGINLAFAAAVESEGVQEHDVQMSSQRSEAITPAANVIFQRPKSVVSDVGIALPFDAYKQQSSHPAEDFLTVEGLDKDEDRSFAKLVQVGSSILHKYYNDSLDAIKQHIVDYIHGEALDATHAARVHREESWLENMTELKRRYGDFITNMMSRHFTWYTERLTLRQQGLDNLRKGVQSTSEQLKEEIKERLSRLRAKIFGKAQSARDDFERSTSEGCQSLERQAMFIREGDSAVRQFQETEVESRCQVEDSIRRQLWRAELIGLQENLSKLSSRTEQQMRERFEKLCSEATSVNERCGLKSIEVQLTELRGFIQQQIISETFECKAVSSGITQQHCDAPRAEAEQMILVLMCTAQKQRDEVHWRRQRSQELREQVHENLAVTIRRLQESWQTQKSQQSKIDYTRKMWQRDLQQGLSRASELELPLLGFSSSEADEEPVGEGRVMVETLAAPRDTTLVYFLQLIADRLQERDRWRDKLRTTIQVESNSHSCQLKMLGKLYEDVSQHWMTISNTFKELQRAQFLVASHHVEVQTEIFQIKMEKERLEKERRALFTRHEKLNDEMASAEKELNAALVALTHQKHQQQQQQLRHNQL